jgi:glucose/arabinose dehydrogenase
MNMRLIASGLAALAASAALCVIPSASAQIFVVSQNGAGAGIGTIGEFTTSGETVNRALIEGLSSPEGIAASGEDLFISDAEATISKFTTSGAMVNPMFISGLNAPEGMVVSGGNLFVANFDSGKIGEYNATTGAAVNPTLVSGLSNPRGIAVSDGDLFVANSSTGTLGKYERRSMLR